MPSSTFGDVDVLDLREHQVADEDQGGRRRDARDDPRDRRQEDREQEQDAGDDRREAGPAAFGDARRGLDVRGVRADARRAPPAIAATESTSSTRPTPGTEPSSFARPASAATPVAVPIVSKKSVSMIVKMMGIAVSSGRTLNTWVRSNWPSVVNDGVSTKSDGTWSPRRSAR